MANLLKNQAFRNSMNFEKLESLDLKIKVFLKMPSLNAQFFINWPFLIHEVCNFNYIKKRQTSTFSILDTLSLLFEKINK